MELQGKRLLVLGGTYNLKDIREYADKNGVVLIASGNRPDHPLCSIADEYYPANVKNSSELIQLIEKKSIDGVFAGSNEDIISIIFEVMKEKNLPFYANKEQWDVTGNKRAFKTVAQKAGLPVVPEYKISENPTQEELASINFPVVVKPVDGSGSQGVFLCMNAEELISSQKKALQYSRSKTLMIEKYMSGFVIVFYMTIIDGVIHVESMADKYTKPSPNDSPTMPTIAQVYLYPSRHLQYCLDCYFPAMERLIHDLKIKDGVVGIQGFCDGKDIVFTEMGYRLGGTSQQNYTKRLYGESNMFFLMNYALTGKMTDNEYNTNPYFPKECCTIQLISRGGVVAREEGIETVQTLPEVISFEKHYTVGDRIPVVDNVSMVHFRIFVVADNLEQLKAIITKIQNTIKVWDSDGNFMLDDYFDVSRLGNQ